MSHIVYCWEMGGGLGHMMPLARLSAELVAQGHRVTCILTDLSHAPRLLAPHQIEWLSAPRYAPNPSGGMPLNHADILRGVGYDNPDRLFALVSAWRTLFTLLRPDRVICEYAPTARLAAHSLQLPVACIDTGFYMPPISDPMPALRDHMPVAEGVLRASEQRTLNVINDVMQRLKQPPLPRFAGLFEFPTWYRNWVEFNHFGVHSPERHLGQVFADSGGADPVWPKGEGRRIFAYLKSSNPNSMSVLEAAVQAGYRVLAYLPGFPPHMTEGLRKSGRVVISELPVRLGELDDDIDIGIWHSPTGAVARCLEKGMRMLFLPSHVEQYRACMAVQRAGLPAHVALDKEDWASVFQKIESWPRHRLGDRWRPADVPDFARRLVA